MLSLYQTLQKSTGWLLLLMTFSAVLCAFMPQIPSAVPGTLVWVCALLLLPRARRTQLIQVSVLVGIGAIGLLVGELRETDPVYLKRAIDANQLVISMLVAVSFLRLIALAHVTEQEHLPTGVGALIKTLIGTHIFGTVMNISSVMIVGDRLTHKREMTPTQAFTLLRGFSICACWSPFFASMGVTLLVAPGANLATLILFGLPVALFSLALTAWQLSRLPDAASSEGYPLTFSSVWMPLLLAALVMSAHFVWPNLIVLTLVTLISLSFALLWMIATEGVGGLKRLHRHIKEGLPKLSGEVMLFLSAAVLASGVGALLESLHLNLAPEHFDLLAACATILVMIVMALCGMHPVTTVVLVGSILAPSVSDPNLLGLTLLFSWGLGVCFSPFSGVQLTLQSRYFIRARDLARMNLVSGLVMLLAAFSSLAIYSELHHV